MDRFLLHLQRGAGCRRKVTGGPGPPPVLSFLREKGGVTGSDSSAEAAEDSTCFMEMKSFKFKKSFFLLSE